MRAGRGTAVAAGTLETGTEIVSVVAMARPSNGADGTADEPMPQRRSGRRVHKNVAGKGIPATPFARGKKLSRLVSFVFGARLWVKIRRGGRAAGA